MSTILIIKPSSLGDIVHGLLVARMIKDGLPGAVIHWVCRDIFAPLVLACPAVDLALPFHRKSGPGAFLRLAREIRRRRYDLVLDFQGLARTGLLALFSGARQTMGRRDAREGARFCYGQRVPLPAAGRHSHAVDILAEFLPALGLPRRVQPRLPLRISGEGGTGLALAGRFETQLLLFPESRRPEKNWPFYPELTAALCRDLPDVRIAWAGAQAMACPRSEGLENFENLTASTALPDLISLIARTRLVVGNDSGPLHLAAAMGVATLALFGPTDPARFRPWPGDDLHNHVLRAPGGRFSSLPESAVLDTIRAILEDL